MSGTAGQDRRCQIKAQDQIPNSTQQFQGNELLVCQHQHQRVMDSKASQVNRSGDQSPDRSGWLVEPDESL